MFFVAQTSFGAKQWKITFVKLFQTFYVLQNNQKLFIQVEISPRAKGIAIISGFITLSDHLLLFFQS